MAKTGDLFSSFLLSLDPRLKLPETIQFINPYSDRKVRKLVKQFNGNYYKDNQQRILILGINPGRFGSGITGIPFTDPVSLEEDCGIINDFEKRRELSSKFIYELIDAFGGPEYFYRHFLLSAVCPLGFLKGSTNYNYYDSKELFELTTPFISDSLVEHSKMNISRKIVIAFGKKNGECLQLLNRKLNLFQEVISFDHPRYIMQYKLSEKNRYISEFVSCLNNILTTQSP